MANSKFQKVAKHLLPQVVSPVDGVTIDNRHKILIRCGCGKINVLGARSLVSRWAQKKKYLCKSCSVKSYANSPGRLSKFKKSFSKTITESRRKDLSEQGKRTWTTERRQRQSKLMKRKWKNPAYRKKRLKSLKKAHEAFMKTDYKSHLVNIARNQVGKQSMPERIINALLSEIGVEFQAQYKLGYYLFDFRVEPDYLIEVQGEYWHKDTVARDSAKATYAEKMGYKIIHIWENEFSEVGKVRRLIMERLEITNVKLKEFSMSDTIIREASTKDARVFLGRYHYLPALSKYGKHYGAFIDDKMVAVCTFSGLTRLETAKRLNIEPKLMRELSRFCIHPAYQKKNFASFLLSRFTKRFKKDNQNICALVSFADRTEGHEGIIYKAANWTHDGECTKSYYYISPDGFIVHKKTVWDRAKKLTMTESAYAKKHGYDKRKQLQKSRFVLYLK